MFNLLLRQSIIGPRISHRSFSSLHMENKIESLQSELQKIRNEVQTARNEFQNARDDILEIKMFGVYLFRIIFHFYFLMYK